MHTIAFSHLIDRELLKFFLYLCGRSQSFFDPAKRRRRTAPSAATAPRRATKQTKNTHTKLHYSSRPVQLGVPQWHGRCMPAAALAAPQLAPSPCM